MENEEIATKAIAAAKKWFYETFEDELLEEMARHKLIAQAEGFSISCIAELSNHIEAEFLVDS